MALRRQLRIKDHLDYTISVPQVNENESSMVSATVNPPRQRYRGAYVLLPQFSAAMRLEQALLLYWEFEAYLC